MQKALRIIGISYLVYLALSLLVITPLLNVVPHWYLEDTYGRQLQTKWVLFNPFTLSLEVREAAVPEKDGGEFAGFDALSVNLSVEGLWREGWVFDRLALTGLYAFIVQLGPEEFNFSDFLAGDDSPPAGDSEAPGIPGITIKDVQLQARDLAYTDRSRDKPVTSHWRDLAIAVRDLSTVHVEGQPYTLQLHGPSGGRLDWAGTVSIAGASSEGTLALTDIDLHTLWEIAEPWLTFEVSGGRLSVQSRYAVNWGESLDYQASGGQVALRELAIVPLADANLPDTGVRLAALDIGPVELDGAGQSVEVGDIDIGGLDVRGWMEDDRLSLQELFLGPADPNAPPPPEAAPGTGQDANAGWRASVNAVRLSDSAVTWRSGFTDPATLSITPIEASAGPIAWPLAGDTDLSLSLRANDAAAVGLQGVLALAEGDGRIEYTLEGLPLTWFNPNLPAAVKAEIIDGALAIGGAVELAEFAPQTINLAGAITRLSVRVEDADVPISGWETLRVDGLAVDMVNRHLLLEKLAINSYSGRIHIMEDGSINASKVLQEELGDEAGETGEEPTEGKPWTFEIPQVVMTDSKVDFMDQSLPIPFRTVIGDLNGQVLGLGGQQPAQVDFEGSVDGYAPVTLKGSTDPFTDPMFLDLELMFDGLDMALLSPYSSTYAGYAIDQGLLHLELGYSLKDNHLEGKNRIRMDQLKLGEKVASDKAIDAPLELALSIMTDANGVIDVSVPVSGDVNDPDFNIGGVVGKAVLNILTKAVTAPFKLLAGLVNSEEDLQRVTFSTGSAELNAASEAKLQTLAEAMAQRPRLALTVTGKLNIAADRERLQRRALEQQLVEGGLDPAEVDTKGPAWESAVDKRYRALGIQPAAETEPTSREKFIAVARTVDIADEQLLELAERRAVAVKTYLVQDLGIEPSRAVIAQARLDQAEDEFSGVMLGVE